MELTSGIFKKSNWLSKSKMPTTGQNEFYYLIALFFIAAALRLIPPLILGTFPFYDPIDYSNNTRAFPTSNDFFKKSYLRQSHAGFRAYLIVLFLFTDIPLDFIVVYFPPIFNSLSVFPMYLLSKILLRNSKSALTATLFFSVTEIIVLRQSYLIPEGFAISIMLLVIYSFVKAVYSHNFVNYSIVSAILFYCLCSFHNLTATMTLVPILLPLFLYPFVVLRVKRSNDQSTLIISPERARKLVITIIILTAVWLYWAKEAQYSDFMASFISLDIEAILISFGGQAQPSSETFSEHYYATQQTTILDLAAMGGGSILIFLVAVLGFIKLLRRPRKDFRFFILACWAILMFLNFGLNLLIDTLFSARTYGQQVYRAWVFLIIPLLFFASIRLTEIRHNTPYLVINLSLLLILVFSTTWFLEFLMESFPHV